MATPQTKTLSFSVFVEKHDGYFVGTCLETGLVATALEEEDVLAKMSKLVSRQIQFAVENGRLRDAYHRAPNDIWNKWMELEQQVVQTTRGPVHNRKSGFRIPQFMIEQNSYAAAC